MSAAPELVSITEYRLTIHGAPVVAMTNDVAAAIQRAGLATREHVVAALTTAVDLAAASFTAGSNRVSTMLAIGGSWRELWLCYLDEQGGYVATWPGDRP